LRTERFTGGMTLARLLAIHWVGGSVMVLHAQ
jgi:hypothetical protein